MANTHSIDLELSSSQYLSITDGDQTGLDLTTDFTIEAWIKLEQLPSTAGNSFYIISKATTGSTLSYWIYIDFTNNKLTINFSDNGAFDDHYTRMVSDNAIVDGDDVGEWVHIAVTVDISVPSAVMYKNTNVVADTVTASFATSIYDSNSTVMIGAVLDVEKYFDGLIDEVRVWSDVRTAQEISDNYDKELVGNEAGLVAYWKLNNSLLDETANNNDLTNNGNATFSTDTPFGEAITAPFPTFFNS